MQRCSMQRSLGRKHTTHAPRWETPDALPTQAHTHYLREQLDKNTLEEISSADLIRLALRLNQEESALLAQHIYTLLAHASLPDLLRADIRDLQAQLGTRYAVQLKAVLELARRLTLPAPERYRIACALDAATLLLPEMAHLDHEELRVLVLDSKQGVLAHLLLYKGTLNSSVLRVAEIYRPAVQRNAASVLLAHNHPSGLVDPSPDDLSVTQQLVEAGKALDIELLDHLIIGNQRFKSLREHIRW
jgi:DNA repair protein RadC